MVITFKGLGFLGFMIPMGMWGLASVIWGHDSFGVIRVALLLAAVAVWVVGRKLNREAREDGDDAPHQALGFPMQWSAVLVLAGVGLTFA